MDRSEPALRRPGDPGDTGGADTCTTHLQTVEGTCERGVPALFIVLA